MENRWEKLETLFWGGAQMGPECTFAVKMFLPEVALFNKCISYFWNRMLWFFFKILSSNCSSADLSWIYGITNKLIAIKVP